MRLIRHGQGILWTQSAKASLSPLRQSGLLFATYAGPCDLSGASIAQHYLGCTEACATYTMLNILYVRATC